MEKVRFPELRDMLSGAIGSRTEQEIADWVGVSQPAVNKWLNGYTQPKRVYLAILSAYLNLDPVELAMAAGYQPEEIMGVMPIHESISFAEMEVTDFINSEEQTVNTINTLWDTGSPQVAIDQSIIKTCEIRTKLERYLSPKRRFPLLRFLSRVLHEQGVAICVSRPPYQAWEDIQNLVEKQYEIAEELGDDEPLAAANYKLADAYSGLRKYDKARWHFSRALEYTKNDYWELGLTRLVMQNFAYIGDKKAVERGKAQIMRLLDKGQYSNLMVITGMEGIGRSQALIGDCEGLKTLEKTRSIIDKATAQGEQMIYKQLQLTKSEILATVRLEKQDKNRIQELGERGLELVRQHGYLNSKYTKQFEKSLQEVSD